MKELKNKQTQGGWDAGEGKTADEALQGAWLHVDAGFCTCVSRFCSLPSRDVDTKRAAHRLHPIQVMPHPTQDPDPRFSSMRMDLDRLSAQMNATDSLELSWRESRRYVACVCNAICWPRGFARCPAYAVGSRTSSVLYMAAGLRGSLPLATALLGGINSDQESYGQQP